MMNRGEKGTLRLDPTEQTPSSEEDNGLLGVDRIDGKS